MFDSPTKVRGRGRKCLFLCLYMKTIRAKQAKVYFAYFVQRDQDGIISRHLTLRKVLFSINEGTATTMPYIY